MGTETAKKLIKQQLHPFMISGTLPAETHLVSKCLKRVRRMGTEYQSHFDVICNRGELFP